MRAALRTLAAAAGIAVASMGLGPANATEVAVVAESPQRQWATMTVPFLEPVGANGGGPGGSLFEFVGDDLLSIASHDDGVTVWSSSEGVGGFVPIGRIDAAVSPRSMARLNGEIVMTSRDENDALRVFSSADGGRTWNELSSPIFATAPMNVELHAVNGAIVATALRGFFETAPMLRTTDLTTWTEVPMPGATNSVRTDGEVLYAVQGGVAPGGDAEIWSSTDAGATFASEDPLDVDASIRLLEVVNGRLVSIGGGETHWLDPGEAWVSEALDATVFGDRGVLLGFTSVTRSANGTVVIEIVRDCLEIDSCDEDLADVALIHSTDGVAWSVIAPSSPRMLVRFKQTAEIVVRPDGSIYAWSRSFASSPTDPLFVQRLVRSVE